MKLPIAFQAAFDSVVPDALKTVWKRYLDERRAMLIEELRVANVDLEDACKRDEVVAMLIKFFQAMLQGAAFRNLRLIAQILAGKAAHESSHADDFIMWADAIGSMTPAEIVFLARLYDGDKKASSEEPTDNAKQHSRATSLTRKAVVGSGNICPTNDHYQMLGAALARTGFVIPVSSFGELTFAISPRGRELMQMARVNEAADDAFAELMKRKS